MALLAVSVGCYIAAFTFSGILFIWFNPSGEDCGLNVFFIVMTMILAFAFGVIALHPKVSVRLSLFDHKTIVFGLFFPSLHCTSHSLS